MLSIPTNAPTASPQLDYAPSSTPSSSSIAPATTAPTAAPSLLAVPSNNPSMMPTAASLYTGPLEIVFEYDMYTDSDYTASEILTGGAGGITESLVDATERVTMDALGEFYPSNNRRRRRRAQHTNRQLRSSDDAATNHPHRHLTVSYQSTSITGLTANGCPYEENNLPANTRCFIASSTVNLNLVDEPDKDAVHDNMLRALNDSIPDGSFLTAIVAFPPGGDAIIGVHPPSTTINPIVTDPITDGSSSEDLHPGIYAGVALAGAAVVLGVGFVQYRRNQRKKASRGLYPHHHDGGGGSGTLGADEIHYMLHGSTRRSADFRALGDPSNNSEEEISVGSSGWSSNGTSIDHYSASSGGGGGRGNSLAAVAVASGAHSRISTSTSPYGNNNNGSSNNYGYRIPEEDSDDDDSSQSQSETSSELIGGLGMARKSRLSLSNQQQEHEDPGVSRKDLDVAIDASDWATVGATAALLATTQTPVSQQTRGAGAGSTNSNRTGMSDLDQQRANELDHLVDTGDWEGVVLAAAKFESSPGFRSDDSSSMDPSAAGFTVNASLASETPSNIKKRSEILAEVEDLVRKVVPDEAENIDEMMRQFYGREEELLETLRSMQERAIAQRQRLAVQKSAKREAVQLKSVPQAPSAPEAGDTVASGSNAETSTVFSDPQFEGIQAEDVGSGSGSGSKTTTDGSGSGFGGVPPAVALRKTKEDDEKERLEKEEQDALAQAAIWKKIAAANKPEEGTDSEQTKGARAAADWAIERSLSALKNVERDTKKAGSGLHSGSMDEVIEEDEV